MLDRSPQLRFVLLFTGLYVALHTAYFQIPHQFLTDVIYRWAITEHAATAINLIADTDVVSAAGHRLVSKNVVLEIVRGCDGSGVFFIVAAAIIAFRAPLRHSVIGVVLGFLLVYGLNQIRVIGLYFVLESRPEWFTPLHTFYIPSLLIVIVSLFYMRWLVWIRQDEPAATVSA